MGGLGLVLRFLLTTVLFGCTSYKLHYRSDKPRTYYCSDTPHTNYITSRTGQDLATSQFPPKRRQLSEEVPIMVFGFPIALTVLHGGWLEQNRPPGRGVHGVRMQVPLTSSCHSLGCAICACLVVADECSPCSATVQQGSVTNPQKKKRSERVLSITRSERVLSRESSFGELVFTVPTGEDRLHHRDDSVVQATRPGRHSSVENLRPETTCQVLSPGLRFKVDRVQGQACKDV